MTGGRLMQLINYAIIEIIIFFKLAIDINIYRWLTKIYLQTENDHSTVVIYFRYSIS